MFFNKDKIIKRLSDKMDEMEMDNDMLYKQNEILANTISIISNIISSKTTPKTQKILEIQHIIIENLDEEELFQIFPNEEEPPEISPN